MANKFLKKNIVELEKQLVKLNSICSQDDTTDEQELVKAVASATIKTCSVCDGRGTIATDGDYACHRCMGYGEIVLDITPHVVRAAIKLLDDDQFKLKPV